jgi:hypothetical protein
MAENHIADPVQAWPGCLLLPVLSSPGSTSGKPAGPGIRSEGGRDHCTHRRFLGKWNRCIPIPVEEDRSLAPTKSSDQRCRSARHERTSDRPF